MTHVLVVDDDPVIADLVAFRLGRLGLEVSVESDGEAGLAASHLPLLLDPDAARPARTEREPRSDRGDRNERPARSNDRGPRRGDGAALAQYRADGLMGEALGVDVAVEPLLLDEGDQPAVDQQRRRSVVREAVDAEDHVHCPSVAPTPRRPVDAGGGGGARWARAGCPRS